MYVLVDGQIISQKQKRYILCQEVMRAIWVQRKKSDKVEQRVILDRVKRKGLSVKLLPEQRPDWSKDRSHAITYKEQFRGGWSQDKGARQVHKTVYLWSSRVKVKVMYLLVELKESFENFFFIRQRIPSNCLWRLYPFILITPSLAADLRKEA